MSKETLLLQIFGGTPKLKIIDFFLENRSDYSKKEIKENTNLSKTTFYNVWDELEQFEIVKVTRRYGKAKLYMLNQENPIVKRLMALDAELGKQAMEKAIDETPPKKLVRT